MKKLMLIIAVMIGFAANAQAQKGAFELGGSVVLGTGDDFTNYGLGARVRYSFTDHFRGDLNADYFLKKDDITMYDFNANLHYLFNLGDSGFRIYPLAGIALVHVEVDGAEFDGPGVHVESSGASDTDVAFNLGGGIEFPIADRLRVFGEAKEMIKDGSRFYLSAGITYTF